MDCLFWAVQRQIYIADVSDGATNVSFEDPADAVTGTRAWGPPHFNYTKSHNSYVLFIHIIPQVNFLFVILQQSVYAERV